MSLLAAAVRDGRKDLVEKFLRDNASCDLHVLATQELTVTNWAIVDNELEIAALLINAGALDDLDMAWQSLKFICRYSRTPLLRLFVATLSSLDQPPAGLVALRSVGYCGREGYEEFPPTLKAMLHRINIKPLALHDEPSWTALFQVECACANRAAWRDGSFEREMWLRCVDLALVLTHHVASVYEVLWLCEFVIAMELSVRFQWRPVVVGLATNAASVCAREHRAALRAARQIIPEWKRVELIQNIFDLR